MDEILTIRTPKTSDRPYFSMARETAQDKRLSWEARGVLAYLLSKPDDWQVMVKDLQQQCGRDKVKKILKELVDYRYLKIHSMQHDEKGRFAQNQYQVFETPFTENPSTDSPSTANPSLTYNRKLQKTELEKSAPKVADQSQPVVHSETVATQPSDTVPGKGISNTPPIPPPPPKPNSREARFRAEWCQHEKRGEALLKAFGWTAFTRPEEMTRASLEDYLEAAKQLQRCPLEDIPKLHQFVANKARVGNWSGFGVLTLAKYYPEFQTAKQKTPSAHQSIKPIILEQSEPAPFTEAEKAEIRANLAQVRAMIGGGH